MLLRESIVLMVPIRQSARVRGQLAASPCATTDLGALLAGASMPNGRYVILPAFIVSPSTTWKSVAWADDVTSARAANRFPT